MKVFLIMVVLVLTIDLRLNKNKVFNLGVLDMNYPKQILSVYKLITPPRRIWVDQDMALFLYVTIYNVQILNPCKKSDVEIESWRLNLQGHSSFLSAWNSTYKYIQEYMNNKLWLSFVVAQ